MNNQERQEKIISYLAIAPQVQEGNSDRLDEIKALMEEIFESGDLIALMGIAQHANALAQRLVAEQARKAG